MNFSVFILLKLENKAEKYCTVTQCSNMAVMCCSQKLLVQIEDFIVEGLLKWGSQAILLFRAQWKSFFLSILLFFNKKLTHTRPHSHTQRNTHTHTTFISIYILSCFIFSLFRHHFLLPCDIEKRAGCASCMKNTESRRRCRLNEPFLY